MIPLFIIAIFIFIVHYNALLKLVLYLCFTDIMSAVDHCLVLLNTNVPPFTRAETLSDACVFV